MVNFLGSFSHFVPKVFNSILREEGNMTIPMHVMVVASITNLILDPILIFGFSSIPALGVQGAAIASIIARTLATLMAIRAVYKHSNHITIFKNPISFKNLYTFETNASHVLKKINSVALPLSLSALIKPIALGVYYNMLTPYGDASKAIFTLGLTYSMLVLFPIGGLSKSVNVMCSQNRGAKNHERSTEIFKTARLMSFLYVTTFACLFVLFDDFFISIILSPSGGSEFIGFAIITFALAFPLRSQIMVQSSYLVSQGLSKYLLGMNLLGLFYSVFAYILQIYFGEKGVWAGLLLATFLTFTHSNLVIYFFVVKKRRNELKQKQDNPA